MTPEAAAAAHEWAERTTREQGLPFAVEDPTVIDRLAAILETRQEPPATTAPDTTSTLCKVNADDATG